MASSDDNPQERDYSAANKAARRLLQQADAKKRAQEQCGDAIAPFQFPTEEMQRRAYTEYMLLRDAADNKHVLPDAAAAAQPSTMPGTGTMQCPQCNQILCDTQDLAFFKRTNKQQGLEVHLILKPEITDMPPAMISMPACEQKAVASWECACGHKLGDTRNVGPRKATMTAFKSSSVKLFGLHNKSKKSQWPRMHANPPFNAIEVRPWDEFHPMLKTAD